MNIDEFLKLFKYNVNSSCNYMWDCYGTNVRFFTLIKNKVSVVFDTETLVIYELEYSNSDTHLKWFKPEYIEKAKAEYQKRGYNYLSCYDDVLFKESSFNEIISYIFLNQ